MSEGTDPGHSFSYLNDHLGSPIRLVGDGHDQALAYDEFGVPTVEPNPDTGQCQSLHNPFGFTGYQTDKVTGLCYAQARWYDPQASHFMSQDMHWHTGNMIYGDDPVSQAFYFPDILAIRQSGNPYAYCLNNPLGFVDRNGLYGNDVHMGDDKAEYGTITWALELHIPKYHAIDLGIYTANTDYDWKTSPLTNQFYHFNKNPFFWSSVDTRELLAEWKLEKAIEKWNESQTYQDKQEALKHLGQGLHALQDIDAHGEIGRGFTIAAHLTGNLREKTKAKADDINYTWFGDGKRQNNLILSEEPWRLWQTEKRTKEYLAKFIDGTGMELTECVDGCACLE